MPSTAFPCQIPLLLGHRGTRAFSPLGSLRRPPENTLAAFAYAMDAGCNGFEFDVRFARDGRSVLCHDARLGGRQLAATDYAQLVEDRADLASLEDVLVRFGKSAYLDIEVKTSGNEAAVVAAIRAHAPQRGFVISSFLPEVLRNVNEIDPDLPLGYICEHRDQAELWTRLPLAAFIPHYKLVSSQLVQDAHRRALKLLTWTVNRKRDLLRLAAWGVDGLISDDPLLLVRTFAGRATG